MSKSTYKIEIGVVLDPFERQEDVEFWDDLTWRLRRAISDVQSDWPERFIDTMGLD